MENKLSLSHSVRAKSSMSQLLEKNKLMMVGVRISNLYFAISLFFHRLWTANLVYNSFFLSSTLRLSLCLSVSWTFKLSKREISCLNYCVQLPSERANTKKLPLIGINNHLDDCSKGCLIHHSTQSHYSPPTTETSNKFPIVFRKSLAVEYRESQ